MEDNKISPEEIDAVVRYLKIHRPENSSRKYARRILQSTLPELRQLAIENPDYIKEILRISIKYDREVSQHRYFEMQDIPFFITIKDGKFGLSEAILIIAVLISFITWPYLWTIIQVLLFITWSTIVFLLILLARINQRTGLFPNNILLRLLLPTVLMHIILKATISTDTLWSSLFGIAILLVLSYSIFAVSSGRYLGFGSVKLLTIVGLLVGLTGSVLVLAITFAGSIGYIILSKESELPIGWTITIATIISYISSYLLW